ncbi:MAG: dipeptidase [Gemmatimonadota bacterium]|nr:dipeptidase [Gemmatimonadota bacterium]
MRLILIGLAAGVISGCTTVAPGGHVTPAGAPDAALLSRARAIHDRVVTIDTHADIPFNFATPDVDPGVRGTRQVDIPKMVEGGLDVAFFVVFVGQGPRTPEGNERAKELALTKFRAIRRMAEEMHPDKIAIAYRPEQVNRILRSGRRVAAIGIENGYVIGRDLTLIRRYFDLGARYMTLTHGGHNDIGDSATPRADEPAAEHGGLSAFGRDVVDRMNRVGMTVDVSHVAKSTSLDAIRLSRAPVIASHSGVRAVNDHPRNMDDEQLLALKRNGGVIQVVALGEFVKSSPERRAAAQALYQQLGVTRTSEMTVEQRAELRRRMAELDGRFPPATVKDFVNHIDHAVRLIGIDHVGISSDFDGGGGIVGWRDASETFNVTLELVRRGYTEGQIRKLWGGNLLRVWKEVEKVAARREAVVE